MSRIAESVGTAVPHSVRAPTERRNALRPAIHPDVSESRESLLPGVVFLRFAVCRQNLEVVEAGVHA